MFEQAFKNIDDVLWKEAGCTTELDYTEQTSWPLFLKHELSHVYEAKIRNMGNGGEYYTPWPLIHGVKMDELREETQRLASIFERKLGALKELKKSLLHRAFTGQL